MVNTTKEGHSLVFTQNIQALLHLHVILVSFDVKIRLLCTADHKCKDICKYVFLITISNDSSNFMRF